MTDMNTKTEHRCQNSNCKKILVGRRADTKYCDNSCRYEATHTTTGEDGEKRDVWICSGCRYPKQAQAEILPSSRKIRHPVSGSRPTWSGYCVVKSCECPTCHPENQPERIEATCD